MLTRQVERQPLAQSLLEGTRRRSVGQRRKSFVRSLLSLSFVQLLGRGNFRVHVRVNLERVTGVGLLAEQ